jgi:selenocysteine-specific elongation factor
MKYVIVGTAGHIDHGKSALVRALTGIDPDRLEEEKRRGITIDLGFAHLDLDDGLRVGFIDVPGHERFVKNMLAGVGGIDLVLLVVAADESIKPQTREHFDICKLLGIREGLVALTKSDLVERELLESVRMEVQDFVAGSFLEGAPVVPVSARTAEGLEALKSELRRLSFGIAPKPLDLPFRLPIDRAFAMKGFGAVVTGTLIAGRIGREAEVEILPLGRRARVRGVEVHNRSAEVAVAGQRTALNLAGVDARELTRGMVLTTPGLFEVATRLDCALSLLPSARPLKDRAQVHFHSGTAEMLAEVVLIESKEVKPGERAYAQLRLAEPGLYLPGDRFIIRQFSPVTTIGGGTVLDNQPAKHRREDPRAREFLQALDSGDAETRLDLLVHESGELALAALVRRTGWHPGEVLRLGRLLEGRKLLMILGEPAALFVHAEYFRALEQKVLEQMESFHTKNPLVAGLPKEELRGRAGRGPSVRRQPPIGDSHRASQTHQGGNSPSTALFHAVLEALSAKGKVDLRGEMVRLTGREVRLNPQETAARDQILLAFERADLAVPSARAVLDTLKIDRARADKILQILLRERALVKVAEDLIFHRAALEKLRELLTRRRAASPRINVSSFKEITGLSRKYAIPLLEYLDRERVTRREGDERIIL